MPATQETDSVFIEIREGNWSNPSTGIQELDEDNTTVDAGLLFEGLRTGAITEDTHRGGNI